MDVSQLPQDIQNAIDPQFAGANNGPVIPGTNMPLPPNSAQNTQAAQPAPVAPDLGAPNAPGSLADKISKAFLEHLAANQPQRPQQQPQPSTGQKIVNGAEGVMTALGDAAHSSDRPGGWLSGVTNVLNARNQRQAGRLNSDSKTNRGSENSGSGRTQSSRDRRFAAQHSPSRSRTSRGQLQAGGGVYRIPKS